MSLRNQISIFAVFAFLLLGLSPMAEAGHAKCSHGSSKTCSYGQGSKSCDSKKKLSDKIFYKGHFILDNEEELGLSEEQVQEIKGIMREAKKVIIETTAKVDIIKIDIWSELYKYPVNAEAIEPLIDQKYSVKVDKSKALVNAFADLKAVLTEDQYEELKEIWKSQN